ncbi:MAG TPA: hypothetical protein VF450_17675 [Noviherbaspirillum sp.]|jgi:hypothetical protein
MSNRDALFAVTVLTLGLSGMAGVAAAQASIGGSAVQAQAEGFEVLANRMFGGKVCSAADGQ